ncbi:MAG: hypothetical protein WAK93_09135 [Solirubrobacteraceae bacterium]
MRIVGVATLAAAVIGCAIPASASAASSASAVCGLSGLVGPAAHKPCHAVEHPQGILSAGGKVVSGAVGGVVKAAGGPISGLVKGAATATARAGASVLVGLAVGAARYLLQKTASVIGATTRPNLTSTWFSASYWRMAAVSALLTLPFLFAAAIQAMVRSDLALLARAAFGYLPLGLLAVAIAAPVTMLLLSASDEMSAIVASASGHADADFLAKVGVLTGVAGAGLGTEFVAFFVALLTVAATIMLWIELVIRDAAIYVIVLMLPLFFAAMVWPARRIWATRSIELLVALIMSKFAIVAVLSLGGAALGHALIPGPASILTGATLVLLAAFSPWALLRLLPLHELASAAVGGIRVQATGGLMNSARNVAALADGAGEVRGHLAPQLPEQTDRLADTDRVDGATNGRARSEDAASAGPGVVANGTGRNAAAGAVAGAAADGSEDLPTPNQPTVSEPPSGSEAPPSSASGDPERGAGMDPLWQAQDPGWRPVPLADPEAVQSPPPLLLPAAQPRNEDPAPTPDAPNAPQRPLVDRDPLPAPPAEDHDPLPPTEDGPL